MFSTKHDVNDDSCGSWSNLENDCTSIECAPIGTGCLHRHLRKKEKKLNFDLLSLCIIIIWIISIAFCCGVWFFLNRIYVRCMCDMRHFLHLAIFKSHRKYSRIYMRKSHGYWHINRYKIQYLIRAPNCGLAKNVD